MKNEVIINGRKATLGKPETFNPENSDHTNSNLYELTLGDAYFHSILVWNHLNMKNRSFLCQLAGLFHDTGKAYCSRMENGRIISYGHEKKSTEIVEKWMKEYKFSNSDIEYVVGIVANHMKFHQAGMSNATLRKLMVKPFFNDLIIHIEADVACGSKNFDVIDEYKSRIEKLKENQLPDKLFTGNDLIKLGMKPNEEFGKILKEMFDAQLNGEFSDKEEAKLYFSNKYKGENKR